MLDHQKKMLSGVANDMTLFKKELYKSLIWLNPEELGHLRKWLKLEFGEQYKHLINDVFYSNVA